MLYIPLCTTPFLNSFLSRIFTEFYSIRERHRGLEVSYRRYRYFFHLNIPYCRSFSTITDTGPPLYRERINFHQRRRYILIYIFMTRVLISSGKFHSPIALHNLSPRQRNYQLNIRGAGAKFMSCVSADNYGRLTISPAIDRRERSSSQRALADE